MKQLLLFFFSFGEMWRAGLDTKGITTGGDDDDDWETDPDFVVSL